jgi:hypothetical protein
MTLPVGEVETRCELDLVCYDGDEDAMASDLARAKWIGAALLAFGR